MKMEFRSNKYLQPLLNPHMKILLKSLMVKMTSDDDRLADEPNNPIDPPQKLCTIGFTNSDHLKSLIITPAARLACSSTILRNYKFIQPKVLALTPQIVPSKMNSQTKVTNIYIYIY